MKCVSVRTRRTGLVHMHMMMSLYVKGECGGWGRVWRAVHGAGVLGASSRRSRVITPNYPDVIAFVCR